MKYALIFFIVSTFTITVYGQASGRMRNGMNQGQAQPITFTRTNQNVKLSSLDQASIRCYYQFVQKDKAGLLQIDTMTLDIGAQMSKYYDLTKQKQDSLYDANLNKYMSNINPNTIRKISVIKNQDAPGDGHFITSGKRKESAQLFKSRQTGQILIIDGFEGEYYRFAEAIPPQAWQIAADTATILGYLCQKAIATFRGRNYEAWFSPEIPVNDGPWKFFGLPGLILKITDTENIFSFTCVGIENLTPPRDITIEQVRFINASRNELATIKLKKEGELWVTNNGGNIILGSSNAKDDYYPLELE